LLLAPHPVLGLLLASLRLLLVGLRDVVQHRLHVDQGHVLDLEQIGLGRALLLELLELGLRRSDLGQLHGNLGQLLLETIEIAASHGQSSLQSRLDLIHSLHPASSCRRANTNIERTQSEGETDDTKNHCETRAERLLLSTDSRAALVSATAWLIPLWRCLGSSSCRN